MNKDGNESAKQRLFKEINDHLVFDEKPSAFFNGIKDEVFFLEFPFTLLNNLKEVEQSPHHHPEGNVWNHTMLVIDVAAKVKKKSKDPAAFMWAALLHDIGKADTTRNRKGKITAYNHDKLGAKLTREFLEEYFDDKIFIQKVTALVRWHMQILFVVKSMQFADITSMKKEVDIKEVALLGYCDRMGRHGVNEEQEDKNIEIFVKKCIEN